MLMKCSRRHVGWLTLVVMILIVSRSVQHAKYLEDVAVAVIAMKLVARAIKTEN